MSETLRILLLEDRAADAELVTNKLREGGLECSVVRVATESAFLTELRNPALDLILADYSLPAYDGLSALAAAQEQRTETPFIFVSGSLGEERAIEALHRGATDYVLKDRLARLEPAVRRALREREEIRKRAEAEQQEREGEKQFSAMFEMASIGMAQADPQTGRWLRVNQKMCAITGYSTAELVGTRVPELTHPEDRQRDWEMFQQVVRGEAPDYRLEKRYLRKDGAVAWVNVNMTVIRDAAGRPTRSMATIEDITERKEAEERVREVNLMLRASSAINALMVRERDPGRMLAQACNVLVDTRGYRLAWIGMLQPGSKRVLPVAKAGKNADFLDSANITWDETPTGQGPIGTAIRTGQPIACLDTATDPIFAPWKDAAKKYGLASMAAMPLIHGSRTLGAVAVYTDRTGMFDGEEIELLAELASNLAFALQSIEHEQERKRAEELLRESERRYRLLFNSGNDAVFVHDGPDAQGRPGKFLEVNEVACKRLGYTRDELLQLSPLEIDAPESAQAIPETMKRLMREKHGTWEAVNLRKNGTRFPVEISAELFDLNGKPTFLSIVRDITERERAQAHLRLLREALESTANAIVITDRDGIIIWANAAFTTLSGYTVEEALGRKPSLFKSGQHDQAFYARLWETVLAGRVWSAEMVNRRKNGTFYTEEITITPVRNETGEITHFIAVKQDITERKRAELRTAAFVNLGQRLNAAKTAKEAGEIIVGVADDLLGWDACVFDLYSAAEDRISDLLTMDLVEGRRIECPPPVLHGPPTEMARRAIEQGGQLMLRDLPGTTPVEEVPFGDTSRASASIMFVPVRHGTKVVGVLSIQSYTPRAYDAYSLETLQALADHGGGALERLRAQEALSESEANFRSVWEHSIDGMRLTNWEGRIVAVNEAYCRLVRLPREKLEGQIISVAYKGHGPNDGIEVYQQRFANGDIHPHDTRRAELWNSEVVDLEISNSFIELGQRDKVLLSIFRDVSERRRAELRIAALSKLGQRLSAAKTVREAAVIITGVADELLGWDACTFSLLTPSRELLDHLLQVDTVEGRRVEENPGYEQPSEMARRTIVSGAQLVVKEQPSQALPGSHPFGDSARPSASILYVPVRQGAQVIGIMSIHSYTPGAYDRRSLETLQALADHCGGALERLRIEEAWQNSQRQLTHLLTQSPAVIYSLKTDGKTAEPVWVSDNVERLLGYTAAECQGPEGLFNQVHPQDRQAGIDGLVELFAAKQVVRDYRVRHKNGEYRWVRDEQRLACEAADAPAEIVGSWTDITERKRAEQGQQESERRFREMLENVELIAMTLDTKGAITFCNDYLLRITGWQRAETIGADWLSCFVPETHLEVKETLLDNVVDGKIPSHYEYPIRTRKGELRQIVWNNTILRDAAGNVIGVASIGEDITERNVLEEQLRQAQKLEAVGQLAGGVAHDFNNMLAVIRGNAELLLMDEGQYTAETKEGLKQVVGASERAANLTRQLLAFSRKQVLQPQPLVLNDVIANLTKMVSRVIGENIDLQCHYAAPLAHVHADTGMMEQVILNLVVNARDAMPRGGRLMVATEQHTLDEAQAQAHPGARAGDYVCLVVSDTGSGIAPEVLPRIFEPFFTTKEVGKGTGLGLATVYGIVQQHQGWLEVSSQVGEGSSFKVFLPAIATPAQQATSAGVGGDAPGGTEKILLVEDDHAVRLTARRVLESKGYSIQEASSGREALELWQQHTGEFALLLTDIILPGEMTGRDLAERLWGLTPGLRVVFVSGYSADVVSRDTEFIRRTQCRFLQKPCSSRVLLETVRHCLDGRASLAASREGNREI